MAMEERLSAGGVLEIFGEGRGPLECDEREREPRSTSRGLEVIL